MLQIGASVPAFNLSSDSGAQVSAAGLLGQRYLLYFYPKDDTPGCTRQACAFRDALPQFQALGVPVFGVSADDVGKHQKFVRKHQLNFPLLADPERELIEPIGVWVEKNMYGRTYMGIQRASFLVGSDGRIEMVWPKVSPDRHAAEVQAWLSAH